MNLNYISKMAQEGWRCPLCGRIYSPLVQECYYCNQKLEVDTYKSTLLCDWVYEDTNTNKK